MPQPLTEPEIDIVLRLLSRIKVAAKSNRGNSETWDSPVPLNPVQSKPLNSDWTGLPSDLAGAGAHHLALALFRESVLLDKDSSPSLNIAISALLWEERDLAEEWAMHSLGKLEVEIANLHQAPWWQTYESDILKLAKVFRLLGKTEVEPSLRKRLNELLPTLSTGRDAGMEALRLAVELGYDPEAEKLARMLSPLVVGHSRGDLTGSLFRTLLLHDKQLVAWSLFAMTSEPHDEAGLRYAAMKAACDMEDFELALKFACSDGYVGTEDHPHLVTIAHWLISQKRVQDWSKIWEMLTNIELGLHHRFSIVKRIKFLASLVEHAAPTDRAAILKIANSYQRATANWRNDELAQEISNYHLVIAAWAASKATVRKLVKVAKIPKFRVQSALRAAAERGLPCLLELIPEANSKFLMPDPITLLRFEYERMQRGKRHRLEKVLQDAIRRAFASHDQAMMYNIISFVGRTLKDLDLYRDLLLKYPSMIGPSIVSVWPFITPHVNAGNLIGLEAELSKFDRAQILSEASRDLYSCLKHRFGLAEQLGNF